MPVPTASSRPVILYVTKVPPSDSGVARYSLPMQQALDLLGDVVLIGLAVDARGSQRLRTIAACTARVASALRRRPDVIVIDLSGRALAEYVASIVVAALRPERLWVVAHDPPALVGLQFLFTGLDRRGGRRLAAGLQRLVGDRLDRWLLGRAQAVICLSSRGGEAMAAHHGIDHVVVVPHPAERRTPVAKEALIFCPGMAQFAEVVDVLHALAGRPDLDHWEVVVGLVGPDDEARLRAEAARGGLASRIRFTGLVGQEAFDDLYDRAAVVVRARVPPGPRARNWAAASGAVTWAMAAGCAVVATEARGSTPCVADGGLDLSERRADLVPELRRLLAAPERQEELGAAARAHIDAHHVPVLVAEALEPLVRPADATGARGTAWRRRRSGQGGPRRR